jgi:hypothetical protein
MDGVLYSKRDRFADGPRHRVPYSSFPLDPHVDIRTLFSLSSNRDDKLVFSLFIPATLRVLVIDGKNGCPRENDEVRMPRFNLHIIKI